MSAKPYNRYPNLIASEEIAQLTKNMHPPGVVEPDFYARMTMHKTIGALLFVADALALLVARLAPDPDGADLQDPVFVELVLPEVGHHTPNIGHSRSCLPRP